MAIAGSPFLHIADSTSGPANRLLNRSDSAYRELHESLNIAIVAGMALSKFPFLTPQAGAVLRPLASARLSR
jgi:hypothetical protein